LYLGIRKIGFLIELSENIDKDEIIKLIDNSYELIKEK